MTDILVSIVPPPDIKVTIGDVSGVSLLYAGKLAQSLPAGATFAYGEVGYIHTDGTVLKAQSDNTLAESNVTVICVVAAGITSGTSGLFASEGYIPGLSGGTAGSLVYLSGTLGAITNTQPATGYPKPVGRWLSATLLHFAPDPEVSRPITTDNAVMRADGTGGVPQNSGVIIDDSNNVTGIAALTATSLTDSGLTSGRVPYASTAGLLADSANLTFNGTNFAHGGSGTFGTGTGTNSLGGNTVIATGKKLTVSMTTALDADYTNAFGTPFVSSIGANNAAFAFVGLSNYNGTVGARINGAHTRSTGTDANTIVANNDELARFSAYGADGADFQEGGYWTFEVDGAPGAGDMPTRARLYLCPDGSVTPGLVVTFDNTKAMTLACATDATSATTGAVIAAGGAAFAKTLITAKGQGWGVTSTATHNGATTLVQGSTIIQTFTGTTAGEIPTMPAANLWGAGIAVMYVINNQSNQTITPTRAGSDTFQGGGTTDPILAGATTIYASNGVSVWLKLSAA